MSIAAKIAGLSVVTVPVVGLSNLHWIVSHFSTIATGAAAVTVGAGVWGGHALVGKVKVRNAERKAVKAGESQHVQELNQGTVHQLPQATPTAAEAQAYLEGMRAAAQAQAQSRPQPVIDLGRV